MLQLDVIAVPLISVFWGEEGRDLFVNPYFPFHSCATSPQATDSLAVLGQVGGLICGKGICNQKWMLQNTGADFAVYKWILLTTGMTASKKTLWHDFVVVSFSFFFLFFYVCVPLSLFIYKKRTTTKIQTHAIVVIGYVNNAG